MASVNKVTLLGRVGQAPEGKQTQSGSNLCNLSLATHEVWRDKQGNKQEDLQWHRVTVWGKQAENVMKYVGKGDQLYVEGKLQTDQYEKNGQKMFATKIVAKDIKFLTPKGTKQPQPQQQPMQQQAAQQPQFPPQPAPDMMNDVPF